MVTRRNLLSGLGFGSLATRVSGLVTKNTSANTLETIDSLYPSTSVRTLNGWSLPPVVKHGAKEFHLVAEEVDHEFAPGSRAKCWGYNGSTPGPTIEGVEGDRVRIYVTNHLGEPTSVH